jgi:hypothetical protein
MIPDDVLQQFATRRLFPTDDQVVEMARRLTESSTDELIRMAMRADALTFWALFESGPYEVITISHTPHEPYSRIEGGEIIVTDKSKLELTIANLLQLQENLQKYTRVLAGLLKAGRATIGERPTERGN